MAPHTRWLDLSDAFADRWLTEAVVTLSSSAAARNVATAWMTTYESAVALGHAHDEARARADHAYCLAVSGYELPAAEHKDDGRALPHVEEQTCER